MSSASSDTNPDRQRLLTACGVTADPCQSIVERAARIARQALDAPVAAVGFIDGDEVYFGAVAGIELTSVPTRASLCQAIVDEGAPSVFRRASAEERFSSYPLLEDSSALQVAAGIPLTVDGPGHLASGSTSLGALFVADVYDRTFSETDVQTLIDLATTLESALERRANGYRDAKVLEHTREAYIALDGEWRITHLNARSETLLQRTGRTLLGTTIWEAYPAARDTPFDRIMRRARAEQEPESLEAYYAPLETWFRVRIFPVDDGVTIFFDDVTQQRERDELLNSINANISEGLFRSTPSEGFVYANSAFAEMFGYENREEVLDVPPDTLYADPAGRDRFTEMLDQEDTIRGVEFEFQRRDGSRFWGIVSCTVVRDDEDGVRYYDGAVVDITDRREREKQLRLLERAVSNATEAIMIVEGPPETDSDPQIGYVNRAFTEVTGYSSEEIIGHSPTILEGPESDPDVLRPLFAETEDMTPMTAETVNYRANGESILLQWNLAPVHGEGDSTFWIAVLRNVTRQRRMEQELRERERKVEALYAEMGDLLQASRREHVASHIEDLVIDTLGYPLNAVRFVENESLVPVRMSDQIKRHMPDRPVYPVEGDNVVSRTFRAGQSHVFDDIREVDDSYSRGKARATAYVPIGRHGIISVARMDEESLDPFDVRLLEILCRNAAVVLERIEREDRQRRSIERIDTLRDISQSILSASSTEAVARATLRRLTRLVPYERASVVEFDRDSDAAPIVAVDDPEAPPPKFEETLPLSHFEQDDEQLLRDVRYVANIPNESKDPVERHLTTVGIQSYLNVPLRAEDRVIGALNLGAASPAAYTEEHRDIAREVGDMLAVALRQARYRQDLLQAKRDAEEMNRLKSAFLANMSHEIRTPLTSIIGFTDVLEDHDLGEADRFTTLIAKSGRQLLETIDSVLDLSKLEAGSVQPTFEDADVAKQTREAVELVTTRAEEEEVTLRVDVPDRPVDAVLDRGALRRILHNLLSNAIKFTEAGGSVTARAKPQNGTIILEVEDTGIGIDPSFMPHLFSAFEREGSDPSSETVGGTGLGLAVTKRLVDLLDGSIDVDSTKGQGTCFTITLPRSPDGSGADLA